MALCDYIILLNLVYIKCFIISAAVHPPDIALYVGLAVAIVVFTLLAAVAAYRWFYRHKGGRGALYSAAPGGGIIPDIDKRRLQPDLTQTVAAACYEYPYSEPPPPPEEEEHHYDEPLPPGGSISSLSSSTSNGTITGKSVLHFIFVLCFFHVRVSLT